MSERYDVIIVGLGAMGRATAAAMAAKGLRVLGLDPQPLGHDRGSSHGRSRVIRMAYFEGDFYIPLLRRAYELWGDLDEQAGGGILTLTGGLFAGPADGPVVRNTLASAQAYGLDVETLNTRQIHARWPVFTPSDDQVAIFEPASGVLNPDAAMACQTRLAEAAGAVLRDGVAVRTIAPSGGDVGVETSAGDFMADRLVLCAGAWTGRLAGALGVDLPLRPERRVLHWFRPDGGAEDFHAARYPVNLWDLGGGNALYGFPWLEGEPGVKYAFHHPPDSACDPDRVERTVSEREISEARSALQAVAPAAAGQHVGAKTCLYTMTPDEHFVIGELPGAPAVLVAGGFSGHGYKFAPVVAEILTDLVQGGHTDHDISAFAPTRFR